MRVVIQCAGSKKDGGYFVGAEGRQVKFVAHPDVAPASEQARFKLVRPDDVAGADGNTWRQLVVEYNRAAPQRGNPLRLWPAYELYEPAAYASLVRRFGLEHVFILSAGWGLVRADYLLPNYDITFSAAAEPYKRRRRADGYQDLRQLSGVGAVTFLGGKDYLPQFRELSAGVEGERTIFFNSGVPPIAPGCTLRRYKSAARTNWHYGCAEDLCAGRVSHEGPRPSSHPFS